MADFSHILRRAPVPLIDAERRLLVVWSPKASSAAVYVWFANVCGFLSAVRGRKFPHQHRKEQINSEQAARAREAFDSTFKVLRVIRDPYQRAASIYRHLLATKTAESGVDMSSFESFLSGLVVRDLKTMNSHCWPQVHALEKERPPDAVINCTKQDLFTELNVIAAAWGLSETDFGSMDWLRAIEARRARLSPMNYAEMLTPEARRIIERLYAADFEIYARYL